MKSTFKTIKEEVIEERKIIDGIRGVVDVLDAALVPRGIVGGKKCECKECKGKDCKNCECKDCECAGCEGRIQKEQMEEIKTLVDQILEEKKGRKKKKKGKEEQKKKGEGVISALEGIKSKIDGLISESSDDEPIEETLIGGAIKHVKKYCKTLKRAEGYQDMLYNIYDKVKLVKSPKYSEDGEYVWEVGGKFLTKVPDDPMSIRRQPRPNLEDYADE